MSEENKIVNETEGSEKKPQGNKSRHPGNKHGRYPGRRAKDKKQNADTSAKELAENELTNIEEESEEPDVQSDTANVQDSDSIADTNETADPPSEEMTEVIGVRFRASGKIYYFDNCGMTYPLGCHAIVDTARGMEYGEVAMSNRMVPTSELVLPLRQALRIATHEDDRHHAENKQKESEAAEVWVKKVAQHGLEMKLIDVECTFDNSKLLFYFTAEGRVDFRDLVKDLASVFRCRIELRQMGIRDEAKILGGLGVCGRPFCCHSFLPDFVQVSIKMAKEQNLSLNSAKISGACGRLMCCLRYEYDTYCEEAKLTPKVDSLVRTPDGVAKVIETKPLLGLVKVQMINSPDAAPTVYSRDLLKAVKPGESIEDPAPAPAAEPKDKPAKLQETKKTESPVKRAPQAPRKRQNEGGEKKKNAEGENGKKFDRAVKQEKSICAEKPEHPEAVKPERKYSIQRGKDTAKNDNPVPKKQDANEHRRKNHPPRDRKEKKSGDVS